MTSTSVAAVYCGRLILGFANGFLVTFSNIYTSEASPAHLRGVIVALFAYWVNIGSIIGAAVTNATKGRLDKSSYQIPIGTLFIVPLILVVGLFFVPESPRYLLAKGREAEARKSLETLRGTSVPAEYVELEFAEMVKGVEEEKDLATTVGALNMFKGGQHHALFVTLPAANVFRHQSPTNAALFRHHRMPNRLRYLVRHLLRNLLPHRIRLVRRRRFHIQHYGHMSGLRRSKYGHVPHETPSGPSIHSHSWRHHMLVLPTRDRRFCYCCPWLKGYAQLPHRFHSTV